MYLFMDVRPIKIDATYKKHQYTINVSCFTCKVLAAELEVAMKAADV